MTDQIPSLSRDEVVAFRAYLLSSRRPVAAIVAYCTCLLDVDCDPCMVAGFALAILGRIDVEQRRWALELSLGPDRTIERVQADFAVDCARTLRSPDGFPADFADEDPTVDVPAFCAHNGPCGRHVGGCILGRTLVMTRPDVIAALAEIAAPIGPRRQTTPRGIEVLTRDDVMAMLVYGSRREYVVDLCDALLTDLDDAAPLNGRDIAAFSCLLEVERQRWALAVAPSLRGNAGIGN